MRFQDKERGATLVTALVMLVVLTLLVISAIRSSTTNLRIVGNMQTQVEAVSAGQQAIEQVISTNFTANPGSYASSVPSVIGQTSVVTPVCTGSKALLNNDPNLPADCLSSGSATNTGIVYASGAQATGTSWCYAQQWDVQTTAVDSLTGAGTTLHQGISLDVPAGTTC